MKRTLTVVLILFGFLTIFELANAAGLQYPNHSSALMIIPNTRLTTMI